MSSTAWAICISLVTSQEWAFASPPAERISSTTAEESWISRISIFAPSDANLSAAARPIPLAAPETMATRSFNRLILLFLRIVFPLYFSEDGVKRHQRLQRMCAGFDQRFRMVTDPDRASHRAYRPCSILLFSAQSPLCRNPIEIAQQAATQPGIMPQLEE